MPCEVFANGMSIACKAANGKTVAAMPDVCLSPPSPPAGPLPIPYPNTGMASDATDGSTTVQIGGQEVMLKNRSTLKQSNGDEAATKSFGMGVITHQIQGKINFVSWSMDVKYEGENVSRHLDLTGHNEASDPPNTPPWPYLDTISPPTEASATEETCACCGKAKHSQGREVTENEFYDTPQAQATLAKIKSGSCKDLLPEPPCNKYFITTKREKDLIEQSWNEYRAEYYSKHPNIPKGSTIGHRVPKAAGGCPTGEGNLTAVKPECDPLETELGEHQGRRINSHRKRMGIV